MKLLARCGMKRPVGKACDIGSYEAPNEFWFYIVPLPNGNVVVFSL